MSTIYLEDVVVGYVEESSEAIVNGVDMVRYAQQNDPHAIHIDEAFARSTPFGTRVASFGYVVSLYLRLIHTLEFARAQLPAFLGGLEWRVQFHHPVYADDRLHVRLTVTDKRLTSRGNRGLVTTRYEIVNQHEASVITIDGHPDVRRRDRAIASPGAFGDTGAPVPPASAPNARERRAGR